jgi:hypothetical protein
MTPPAIPRGAWVGTLVGVCGWALGLAVAALVAGRPEVVWQVALPGALVSLALGLLLLVAWSAVLAQLGRQAPATRLVLAGGLLSVLGVLLLLIHVWVEPVLREPEFERVLAATGSVRGVSMVLACLLLAAGVVLLALAARRLRRDW